MRIKGIVLLAATAVLAASAGYLAAAPERKGWVQGRGYGWVWGESDEVGALNTLDRADVKRALSLVKQGKVYDLGITYDRTSYKWPGHAPGEVMTFRSPEGVKRQGDFEPGKGPGNSSLTSWHSCALFMSDNVATQIDGLGHATEGADNHWYNGFKEADWGGDFGVRKCGAETIPPIITRGVLLDVAGYKKVDSLPAHTRIDADMLQATARWAKVKINPGDAVFVRTGALRHWNGTGSDHKTMAEYDSAGIDISAAKWLVADQGAVLVASDTSGLEVGPPPSDSTSFMPVHNYLLIDQGVHIGEFHYLEDLAKDRVYEFAYLCTTNKIKNATAGFTLRPLAIR